MYLKGASYPLVATCDPAGCTGPLAGSHRCSWTRPFSRHHADGSCEHARHAVVVGAIPYAGQRRAALVSAQLPTVGPKLVLRSTSSACIKYANHYPWFVFSQKKTRLSGERRFLPNCTRVAGLQIPRNQVRIWVGKPTPGDGVPRGVRGTFLVRSIIPRCQPSAASDSLAVPLVGLQGNARYVGFFPHQAFFHGESFFSGEDSNDTFAENVSLASLPPT